MRAIQRIKQDISKLNLAHAVFQLGFWGVLNYRISYGLWHARYIRGIYYVYAPLWRIFANITGVEIYGRTEVGGGLKIIHFGQIFIAPSAYIGSNCRIFNGVTVGSKGYGSSGSPHIGDNVQIGAGAKLLGPITIGNDCIIGANAVVTKSFPSSSILAGVPAQVIGIVEGTDHA